MDQKTYSRLLNRRSQIVEDQAKCSRCILPGGCVRPAPFTYPVRPACQSLPNERDLGAAHSQAQPWLSSQDTRDGFASHCASSGRCLQCRGNAVVCCRVLSGLWPLGEVVLESGAQPAGEGSRLCLAAQLPPTLQRSDVFTRTMAFDGHATHSDDEQRVYSTFLTSWSIFITRESGPGERIAPILCPTSRHEPCSSASTTATRDCKQSEETRRSRRRARRRREERRAFVKCWYHLSFESLTARLLPCKLQPFIMIQHP